MTVWIYIEEMHFLVNMMLEPNSVIAVRKESLFLHKKKVWQKIISFPFLMYHTIFVKAKLDGNKDVLGKNP